MSDGSVMSTTWSSAELSVVETYMRVSLIPNSSAISVIVLPRSSESERLGEVRVVISIDLIRLFWARKIVSSSTATDIPSRLVGRSSHPIFVGLEGVEISMM